jgi:hypothetical protein
MGSKQETNGDDRDGERIVLDTSRAREKEREREREREREVKARPRWSREGLVWRISEEGSSRSGQRSTVV